MLRKPPTLHYGSIGGKRKRNTAVLQRSMSRAGGLSRNSDSMADRRDRGSYTSPTLPCGSYPFVNLWEANTLLRKLFTSRKSEKNVRQHSGTQKGAIEAITSIHTGYMIRAPTFRRSTQRQNPHPLQLNTAAPQDLRSAGTPPLPEGGFFVRRHTLTAFCPLAGQPQTRQKGYIYGIFQ